MNLSRRYQGLAVLQSRGVGVIFYVGALLWWLCHPWASFSTGEVKARQLYVDENALVVQALVQEGTNSGVNSESLVSLAPLVLGSENGGIDLHSKDICGMIDGFGATSCARLDGEGFPSMTQIVVDAVSKPIGGEATAFVLPYKVGDNESAVNSVLVTFVHRLMDSSAWLSKRVVILLVGMDCSNDKSSSSGICTSHNSSYYSKSLDEWLQNYVGNRNSLDGGGTKRIATPLIREAYVMELLYSSRKSREIKKRTPSVSRIHYNGVNGALPNMDMVSSTLALFPDTLAVPSYEYEDKDSILPADPVSLWYSLWPTAVNFLLEIVWSGHALDSYQSNLSGLTKNSEALARGGGDGLHSLFLERNIDSITIRAPTDKGLAEMMLQLARVSSNLYEELHHSHFFYVLMGGRHFVGLSEYCGPMGLALLAFFLLFVYLIEKGLFETPRKAFSTGLTSALLDTIPAAVIMVYLLADPEGSDTEHLLILTGHCCVVWGGALLFDGGMSPLEFRAYASVMVLIMQMMCLFTAAVHFTLAFPVTTTLVPLAWLIFGKESSPSSSLSTERFTYIASAFLLGPSTLLIFFREALKMWITSWRMQHVWNLPLLYCIANGLCCGALRRHNIVEDRKTKLC